MGPVAPRAGGAFHSECGRVHTHVQGAVSTGKMVTATTFGAGCCIVGVTLPYSPQEQQV